MSNMKMSDVFGLPLVVCRTNPQMITAKPTYKGKTDYYYATIRSPVELEINYATHAINNHDRLVEENAELKKENEIIEPLVAEKQSLITGLMKENTELRAMLGNIAVSMECNHGVDTDSIFELLDKYK